MHDATYQTKDIGLSCSLVCSNQPIKTILWKDAVAYFIFADQAACDALSQRYNLGQLSVDARTYYDTLRGVKRRHYANGRPR